MHSFSEGWMCISFRKRECTFFQQAKRKCAFLFKKRKFTFLFISFAKAQMRISFSKAWISKYLGKVWKCKYCNLVMFLASVLNINHIRVRKHLCTRWRMYSSSPIKFASWWHCCCVFWAAWHVIALQQSMDALFSMWWNKEKDLDTVRVQSQDPEPGPHWDK